MPAARRVAETDDSGLPTKRTALPRSPVEGVPGAERGGPMDRTAYASRLRNLHSWAGHLGTTIDAAIPQALVELGPAGDETWQDVRNAAEALGDIARSLADVMNAFD